MFGFGLNPIAKAERYMKLGKYHKAIKVLNKIFKKHPNSLDLAQLRFECGQYIPFDESHHQAAIDYFRLQVQFEVSPEKIHRDFVKYMTTSQGQINLNEETLIKLAIVFAKNDFEKNAVFIVNKMTRKESTHPLLASALINLVQYYERTDNLKKAEHYINYLKWRFPDHEKTAELITKMNRIKSS